MRLTTVAFALLLAADKSLACTDFYSSVNGAWLKQAQIALAREAGGADRAPDRGAERRFFINYAAIWRDSMREQTLLNQLRTGQHSPARYHVLGTLANVDGFAQAFGCALGTWMVSGKAERVENWYRRWLRQVLVSWDGVARSVSTGATK